MLVWSAMFVNWKSRCIWHFDVKMTLLGPDIVERWWMAVDGIRKWRHLCKTWWVEVKENIKVFVFSWSAQVYWTNWDSLSRVQLAYLAFKLVCMYVSLHGPREVIFVSFQAFSCDWTTVLFSWLRLGLRHAGLYYFETDEIMTLLQLRNVEQVQHTRVLEVYYNLNVYVMHRHFIVV